MKQLLCKAPSLPSASFRQAEAQGQAQESACEPIVVAGVVAANDANNENVWVSANKNTLLITDKKVLLIYGTSLTDKHINYAQALLKQQFAGVGGLQFTLFQYKPLTNKFPDGVQIIHSHGCLWVVAHKESCFSNVVKVYDSLYDKVDHVVKEVIVNVFAFSSEQYPIIKIVPMQKQAANSNNCGVFAVAVCVAILLKENPSAHIFKDLMSPHMCSCFEQKVMINFPLQ